jgi:glycosyltransferase involved in cell wall biosynthesis
MAINIGVLIPCRGNERPEFLENCIKLIDGQTLQPNHRVIIDFEPINNDVDVVKRYRRGCEILFARGCDVVLFIENDDFYAANYIETMVGLWDNSGRPAIFGVGSSIYYHITGKKYFTINHAGRASAMATLTTKSILNIEWPADNYPYLDVIIWQKMRGSTFIVNPPICIGIKHNIGMVAGGAHNPESLHYKNDDPDGNYLKNIVGPEFWPFYKNLQKNGKI